MTSKIRHILVEHRLHPLMFVWAMFWFMCESYDAAIIHESEFAIAVPIAVAGYVMALMTKFMGTSGDVGITPSK